MPNLQFSRNNRRQAQLQTFIFKEFFSKVTCKTVLIVNNSFVGGNIELQIRFDDMMLGVTLFVVMSQVPRVSPCSQGVQRVGTFSQGVQCNANVKPKGTTRTILMSNFTCQNRV